MEKHRRLVCGATQIIGLLVFVYMLYVQSYGLDRIKFCFGKWNATMQEVDVEDNLLLSLKSLLGENDLPKLETTGFACDSTVHSLVCVASNPVKMDLKSMEIYLPTRLNSSRNANSSLKDEEKTVQVRPYAWAQFDLLKNITPVEFLYEPTRSPVKHCDYNHTIPAVVFSSGGFSGNLFHEFNEIIIPLFITSHIFNSQVQFVITDYNPIFVQKFKHILSSLSRYNALNVSSNTSIHCFPAIIVGLKFHSFLSIDYSEVPKGNSIINFKKFLTTTYGLQPMNVSYALASTTPVLILVSRRKTRSFFNEDEIVDMMEELGLGLMCVLVGAHGAGLTNMVFLPPGAVVVQVVPLGLEWPSTVYFGEPAVQMGLHYLDYKIRPDESSLIDLYPRDDPVISDPLSVFAKGYYIGKEMYLDKQNIKVDVNRFRGTLVEALRLLRHSIPLST
ncbi:O-linked-mannose beta-1,4-N-acetylglucosaminyltransferase 2-like protein [Tanacetum coccineum]